MGSDTTELEMQISEMESQLLRTDINDYEKSKIRVKIEKLKYDLEAKRKAKLNQDNPYRKLPSPE